MSKSLRADMESDPRRHICAAKGFPFHVCGGRITREHAMYYAGKKIQEKWAIPFICAKGHGVDEYQDSAEQLPKSVRQWIALNQATEEELDKFPRAFPSFRHQRDYLNKKYGPYVPPELTAKELAINY